MNWPHSSPGRRPCWNLTCISVLPAVLAKPGPDDHVLVYFSGHGFKDKDGKLYLAPIDCDPADPPATGVAKARPQNPSYPLE